MKCSILFWCLIIQCLTYSPGVLSRCQGIELISMEVYPEGRITLQPEQELEIFCSDDNFTADDLEFVIDYNPIPSEKVNTTTIRLSMVQHKKGVYSYYCRNKVTKQSCPSRVLVDSKPPDVTDFACKSMNMDVLNCFWTDLKMYSATNYSLTLLIEGNYAAGVCTPNKSGKTRHCFWRPQTYPRYRQQEKQFFFILTSCNIFGCNNQNYTIDHFSIVKPDPPNNLKVLGNGTHSVLLQWSIPNNMVDFLFHGVDHKIEYQIAKIDNTSYFREVDTSGLPARNKTYKFLLSDLPYAHMQYEVRIYIRPKEAVKDEFWSDFTYLVFYTASERPKRPPDTVVGAFDQNTYETKRTIYVYWKQLEEYEEAGANFTYIVVAHQGTANPKTLIADNKKSASYVIFENASLGAVNVEIWSTNDNGLSLNSSHLYIPANTDTVALRVPSFTKLGYENGTYKLSWVGLNNIDNYTLFWCQHNTNQICAGRIDFIVLKANETNHVIDLPKGNRYQFAISTNNGTKSSGMVWATCDISKDGIPMNEFPVKLYHDVPGKSFVKITWTMACQFQEGIITGYLITYCPVKDTSNVCDASLDKTTVTIPDPKKMEINITNLKPHTTYKFSLALNTFYGWKRIEHTSTVITTTEDTPTVPINVRISKIESNSAIISWDPPLDKNGIIEKYVIYNYSDEYTFDIVSDQDNNSVRRSFKLEGLDGFSNYSWSVVACNSAIRSCSQKSPINGIFIRTKIGYPSKLSPTIFNNPDVIKWERPKIPGGDDEFYQIMKLKDNQNNEIFNTTNLSYALVFCDGEAEEEKYLVRAVNIDEDPYHGVLTDTMEDIPSYRIPGNIQVVEYTGEWSDPITATCKSKSDFSSTFIILAVIAFGTCIFVVGYELFKYYKRR